MLLSCDCGVEILIRILMQGRHRVTVPHPEIASVGLVPLEIVLAHKIDE